MLKLSKIHPNLEAITLAEQNFENPYNSIEYMATCALE